jgi:hypothetical protein
MLNLLIVIGTDFRHFGFVLPDLFLNQIRLKVCTIQRRHLRAIQSLSQRISLRINYHMIRAFFFAVHTNYIIGWSRTNNSSRKNFTLTITALICDSACLSKLSPVHLTYTSWFDVLLSYSIPDRLRRFDSAVFPAVTVFNIKKMF